MYMPTRMNQGQAKRLYEKGIKLAEQILEIQDKLWEFNEQLGSKFTEHINDERLMRSR